MAYSVADMYSTLQTMSDNNSDIVEFISNLKKIIASSDDTPISITIGDTTFNIRSIASVINDYRQGKFESIFLGGQTTEGKQVKLFVNTDGVLCITDSNGNPISVKCKGIEASTIGHSTVKEIQATNCKINKLEGITQITGGNLKLDSLTLEKKITAKTLTGTTGIIDNLLIKNTMTCNSILTMGRRKLSVSNPRDMFYNGSIALDNYYVRLSRAIHNNIWNFNEAPPTELGFSANEKSSVLPGIIRIQGSNVYENLLLSKPTNIQVKHAGTSYNVDTRNLEFPALMTWPIGFIDGDNLKLRTFVGSDLNKDIYIMTGGSHWKIYRTLAITQLGLVQFSNLYDIPAYSCVRFIVNNYTDGSSFISALEIA